MFDKIRLMPSEIFNHGFYSQELKSVVVRGGMAQIISQGLTFGLGFANTIIMARLLTPADFGIVGMVTIFISFLVMFKDAGLSTATIQSKTINKEQVSTLFWINVTISFGLGIVVFLCSPLVAAFYKKAELTAVTAVLSISFVLQGLNIQHNALLQKHLKFTAMALKEIISLVFSMVVAIVMALFGFRYWALVGGAIAKTMASNVLTFYACPWIPEKPQKGTGVRAFLRFGGHLTGSNFVGFFSRHLDSVLIGKFIGAEPLGLYSRAFRLVMGPLSQIRGPLTNLSLPVLSSLIDNPERYRSYFRQLLDVSISLTLPISVYCFLEGEFLISTLLGQQWIAAIPLFKILSVAGFAVAMSASPGIVMLSHGFSKRYMYLTLTSAIITSIGFVIGLFFGVRGVAMGYAIASFLIMIPLISFGFKNTHINLKLVFDAIKGPFLAVFVSGGAIYLVIYFSHSNSLLKHILIAILYLLVYFIITLSRPKTRETFRSILGSVIKKQSN